MMQPSGSYPILRPSPPEQPSPHLNQPLPRPSKASPMKERNKEPMPLDPAKKNSAALTEGPSRAISILGIALLLFATLPLHAQSNPPSAPLPAAIANAQKLFLGNAGDTDNQDCLRA